MTAMIVIFVFIAVVSGLDSGSGNNTGGSPTPTPELKQDLNGTVQFDGVQFVITNLEDRNWQSCYFVVNNKYNYPSRSSDWEMKKVDGISARDVVTIGSASFTLNNGERFNPFSTKPQELSISCENGFGYWSF